MSEPSKCQGSRQTRGGLDEESKGSEFRLGNNNGSSEVMGRIGSLRKFNADLLTQDGNVNPQARDDTETQSIRDQLN